MNRSYPSPKICTLMKVQVSHLIAQMQPWAESRPSDDAQRITSVRIADSYHSRKREQIGCSPKCSLFFVAFRFKAFNRERMKCLLKFRPKKHLQCICLQFQNFDNHLRGLLCCKALSLVKNGRPIEITASADKAFVRRGVTSSLPLRKKSAHLQNRGCAERVI